MYAMTAATALLLGTGSTALAADAVELKLSIDGRKASDRASNATLKSLEKLANHSLVCLDVKVTVDGSQATAVLTSNEGDMRRYPVDCRASQLGSFPMSSAVEYYVPALGTLGKAEVDLEVYPGSRTSHPFNDVSCVASSEGAKSATLRITGFYTVRSQDFGERRVVEFRPAKGEGVTRAAAAACLD